MKRHQKLLQAITDNYQKLVVTPLQHELDEHIPIYDTNLQIIGYFNIRCYEDLRKTLQKSTTANSLPIGLS